jgi:hypothetical protein
MTIKMNNDREWIEKLVERENHGVVSAGGWAARSMGQAVLHDENTFHADARLAHGFAAQSERNAWREYVPAISGRISLRCNRLGKVTRDLAFKSRRPAEVTIR